ncbi:MAG: N,N-dimethylformamidase [Rhodospirillales bacterium]|nr:N,N-dimethylformamidase [Rhodospirillales bacterium]
MSKKCVVGYADCLSVRAGDTVRFMVSCEQPGNYRADIVRLICADGLPNGAGFEENEIATTVSGSYTGRHQPIDPGSYAIVPPAPAFAAIRSFTAQAMIYPTTPGRGRQAIMGTWSAATKTGFCLLLDDDGSLGLLLGDGNRSKVVRTGQPLTARHWAFVAASFDADTGRVQLHQEPLRESAGTDFASRPISTDTETTIRPSPASGPFLFAGWVQSPPGDRLTVDRHFNGKIDAPRLCNRALLRADIEQLKALTIPQSLAADIVGFWDFSRDIPSIRVADLSSNNLAGETVNLPVRGSTGWNWTGNELAWPHAPHHYGAIHFHDDDLADAEWEPDFALTIPPDMRSGIYAARLTMGDSDDYIPFFVLPPKDRPTADIAFLVPTATYLAYANIRLNLTRGAPFGIRTNNEAMLAAHQEFGSSCYETHSDGSGVVFSTHRRPVLNLKAKACRWAFPADTDITAWMARHGHDFDIVTDDALHAEGLDLIRRYRVVVTGTHPEYVSTPMFDALDGYLRQGGRLMYLGGNGFYWRIAFHPDVPGAIEVRRGDDGTRSWHAEPGEYYHASDGTYGCLWRKVGRPPNHLVGVGFAAQSILAKGSAYRRQPAAADPRAAFVFRGVSEDIIGNFGIAGGGGGAASEELDRCDYDLGSPPHTLILASSEDHAPDMLRVKEELGSTNRAFSAGKVIHDSMARADIVFFETANGGAVFSVGSIGWAGSLAHNGYENSVARITANVLERFLDPTTFPLPPDHNQ